MLSHHINTYNRLASEYDKNAALVLPHNREVIKPFISLLPPGARVLDVGCGVGVATHLY